MEQKAGAQIGQRAFIQSLVILFVLMMIAGILTLVVPAGQYARIEVLGSSSGLTVMSILATNMGFSAAISNPYTLGVEFSHLS